MAEWWEPPGFQAWFYKPYRDIVNKKMKELEDEAARTGSVGGRKRKEKGNDIDWIDTQTPIKIFDRQVMGSHS